MAVEGGFGVVEVQRGEVFHADDVVESIEGVSESVWSAEIVACCE